MEGSAVALAGEMDKVLMILSPRLAGLTCIPDARLLQNEPGSGRLKASRRRSWPTCSGNTPLMWCAIARRNPWYIFGCVSLPRLFAFVYVLSNPCLVRRSSSAPPTAERRTSPARSWHR